MTNENHSLLNRAQTLDHLETTIPYFLFTWTKIGLTQCDILQ